MKKVINCNHDNNPLINKKAKEVSVEEGLAIAEELFQILNQRGDGWVANQVGIDVQVLLSMLLNLCTINPKYIKKEVEIMYGEGCLSYPNQAIRTKRYRDVIIKTAQSESGWYFSGAKIPADESRGSWEVERKNKDSELRLLEAVCVQHEIDHLNFANNPRQRDKIRTHQVGKEDWS